MKPIATGLLALCLLLQSPGRAASPDAPDEIRQSLQTGQAHALATHFARTIELVIDAEAINFPSVGATHAELILSTFFKKYPPVTFRYLYQGNTAGLRYGTGTYRSGGKTFSVYVLMRQGTNKQFVINTLQFRRSV
jgi:hypothetical protein